MTDEASDRYTLDEVMDGLRVILCEQAGKEVEFQGETQIVHVLAQRDGLPLSRVDEYNTEELDYDFRFRIVLEIEQHFRPSVSPTEWCNWLEGGAESPEDWRQRVAPQLTMEKLAAIIVLRSRKVSFEPVTILGRHCEPAGAFYGVEQVACELDPKLKRFGPSTPIRDRLRGSKLSEFWNRVRFCSGRQIPAVVDPFSSKHRAARYANLVTLLFLPLLIMEAAFWVGIIPQGIVDSWVPPVAGIVLGLILVIHARIRIGRLFAYFANPLPPGIHTFRDLTELIVRTRQSTSAAT